MTVGLVGMAGLAAARVAAAPSATAPIPAGALDGALAAFGRESGLSLLYRPETVRGRATAGIRTPRRNAESLTALLAGTGLVARQLAPDTFVIEPAPTPTSMTSVPPSDATDIVVTGTNIRGAAPAAPLVTLDRAAIARTGRTSVADVLATLPQTFGGSGTPAAFLTSTDRTSQNASLASTPDLRGLGANATLTLIDGRRVAGSGALGDLTDLSMIPLAAVERIEVLLDGASAIYGSDAVAGVVNVILRHDFDGFETHVEHGSTTQGGQAHVGVSQTVGHRWADGGILVAYDYARDARLRADQRAATRSADLRAQGGSDWRSIYAVPGTILEPDPATGNYVAGYKVPAKAAGSPATLNDLVPGANLQDPNSQTDVEPAQERHAVYARGDVTFGALSLFGEFRFGRRRFAYDTPGYTTTLEVTPDNPYYLDVDGSGLDLVAYSFARDLGPTHVRGTVEDVAGTAGGTLTLGSGWKVDLYGTHGTERGTTRTSNFPNETLLAEALGAVPDDPATSYSAARDGYFDPFGAGNANTPAVLAFIDQGFSDQQRRTAIDLGDVKADGPLLALPGGMVRAAIGADMRREALTSSTLDFSSGTMPALIAGSGGHRRVAAVFGELDVPLVASGRIPLVDRLAVTAAVRREWYSDFGTTTNPKLALDWSPIPSLRGQLSWGTSFRAPALPQIGDPQRAAIVILPDGTGGSVPTLFRVGGNPDLRPERARTLNAGAHWLPVFAPDLSLGLSYFRTRFTGRIGQPALADILEALSDPALAPFVERIDPLHNPAALAKVNAILAAPGSVGGGFPATSIEAIVDGREVNAASVIVRGLDGTIDYHVRAGPGTLAFALSGSWLLDYLERLTPASVAVERVGEAGRPARLRARGSATWSRGGVSGTLAANYASGSRWTTGAAPGHAPGYATFDAQIGYGPATRDAHGLGASFSVVDLFDRRPPFVDSPTGLGYDPARGDVAGRIVSLAVTARW